MVLLAAMSVWAQDARPAAVSGSVADDCTIPVDNAQVLLVRAEFAEPGVAAPGVAASAAPSAMTTTNDMGEFRLDNVAPGRYLVFVRPAGFLQDGYLANGYMPTYYPAAISMAGATRINMVAGQDVSGIAVTLSMSPMYSMSGHVTEPGSKTRELIVMQRDTAEIEVFRGALGPDGRFIIGGVPPGDYVLRAPEREASEARRTSEGEPSPPLTARVRVLDTNVSGIVISR